MYARNQSLREENSGGEKLSAQGSMQRMDG